MLLAMATLVFTYQALPARKRRALTSFIDFSASSARHGCSRKLNSRIMNHGRNAVLHVMDHRFESRGELVQGSYTEVNSTQKKS